MSHWSGGPAPVGSWRVLTASGELRYRRKDGRTLCAPAGTGGDRLQAMLHEADVQAALQALAAEHYEAIYSDWEMIHIESGAIMASAPIDRVPPALQRFLAAVDRVCKARFGRRHDDPLFEN